MEDVRPARDLEQALGVEFGDRGLLERALVHRSWSFENGGVPTNERLEFLGDAVLAVVVTDEIFHAHADEPEGRLAKVRAAAVKTGSLADVARDIGLGSYVRLGKGEAASGGADKDSILADTLEAVIGALYLDQGFTAAYDLVCALFGETLERLAGRGAALDYKTSLQELTAAEFGTIPHYDVTGDGPDHDKTFQATVRVAGDPVGTGVGPSKKQAEQQAAREAYHRLASGDDAMKKPEGPDTAGESRPG